MKTPRWIVPVLLGCLIAVRVPAAEDEKHEEKESRVKHNDAGETVVTLADAGQKRIGLAVKPVAAASLSPEVKGYGRVLDPAPLVTQLAELAAAKAALEASSHEVQQVKMFHETEVVSAENTFKASQQELNRTQVLFKQKNASEKSLQAAETAAKKDQFALQSAKIAAARAVQTAEAAYKRDTIANEAATQRLVAMWGREIASRKDLADVTRALALSEVALVRVDVPLAEHVSGLPQSARLSQSDSTDIVEASLIGPAPSADPQSQSRGFLFAIESNKLRWPPGTALIGSLSLPGETASGVTVPRSAVVRAGGLPWVFVQTAPDAFTRRAVQTDHATAAGWFVSQGVKAGEKVVTASAQVLLSEELKASIETE